MSDDMSQYSTWYVAMVAAGTVIAAPAGATGNAPFFLVGIGLVLIGVGEFVSHPYQEQIRSGLGQHWKLSGRQRRWRAPGVALDLVGLALFGYGLYGIVFR